MQLGELAGGGAGPFPGEPSDAAEEGCTTLSEDEVYTSDSSPKPPDWALSAVVLRFQGPMLCYIQVQSRLAFVASEFVGACG